MRFAAGIITALILFTGKRVPRARPRLVWNG